MGIVINLADVNKGDIGKEEDSKKDNTTHGKQKKPRSNTQKYCNRYQKPRPGINKEDKYRGYFHFSARPLAVMKEYVSYYC